MNTAAKRKKPFTGVMVFAAAALAILALGACSSLGAKADPASGKGDPASVAGITGNGVNLQPSYYNGGNVDFGWQLMKTYTGIKVVRIEIDPVNASISAEKAKGWIAGAIANGYQVIATYHNYQALGSDSAAHLSAAANWWKANYATLAGAGDFTVNLMNEWGSHTITASAYAVACNEAIKTVRTVYSGPIILDAPGYGQETATLADAAPLIADGNIILSVHVYPCAYNGAKGRELRSSDLDDLEETGKPCIIGEFGNSPTGSCDWSAVVDYAKSLGWNVLGWCWNGDGGSMNMVTPSWSANPTAGSFSAGSYLNAIYGKL